jgi:hypothetical protein
LYRSSGMLADSTALDYENITNGALAYGIPLGPVTIEPNVEGRLWTQPGASTSVMGTVGLRMNLSVLGFSILPSVGYSMGQLAADSQGVVGTANLTGFHGILAIRLR